MDQDYKRMTDFLVGMGVEQVPHTQKSYLGHLIAVHRLLEAQGYSRDVCRAGMFHSLYGTERFQGFTWPLDRRDEVRALVGERAERLAYVNCVMDRASLDRLLDQEEGPYPIVSRTGETIELSREEYDDLCRVHLFDWLEQAARSSFGWDYRRAAYRRMAERLGPGAVAEFDRVYAHEPHGSETPA
jgi:hypothetical protein